MVDVFLELADAASSWWPRRRKSAAVFAGVVLAVALLALVVWSLRALPQPASSPEQVSHERAETLAGDLERDFEGTLRLLPPWAVASLADPAEVSLPVAGTVAVTSGPTCVGVHVEIGRDWVVAGDRDAVQISAVTELPEAACRP